jgi:hypothetical protein
LREGSGTLEQVELPIEEIASDISTHPQVQTQAQYTCLHCVHCGSMAVDQKRFGLIDPKVSETIPRTIEQHNRLSAIASSLESVEQPGRPQPPARSSSWRHAVDHFARQLERYADRTDARGKRPIFTPTTESPVSLHTVEALLPFRAEFQAAGLAVTSVDQRGKSVEKRVETQPVKCISPECSPRCRVASQNDGGKSSKSSSSLGTEEIEFMADDPKWEDIVMMDEVPVRKQQKSGRCGLSCFPKREASSSEDLQQAKPIDSHLPCTEQTAVATDNQQPSQPSGQKQTIGQLPPVLLGF